MEYSVGSMLLAVELTTQSPPQQSPGGTLEVWSGQWVHHPSLPLPGDPAPLPAPSQPPEPLTAGDSDEWGTKEKGWKRPLYFLLQIFEGEERADYMSKYDI